MKSNSPNRYANEIASVARNNPKVDMKQVREWAELAEFLDSLPTPQPKEPEPVKLQPLPLNMFNW